MQRLLAAFLLVLVLVTSASVPSVVHGSAPDPGFVRSTAPLWTATAHPMAIVNDADDGATNTIGGWSPQALWSAYQLPSAASAVGGTVAIVDAYDAPSIMYDMAHYRQHFHLPPCTEASGCFTKLDQNGGHDYPTSNAGWAVEESLDVEMVSAICPRCHIVLIEATAPDLLDLYTAEETAANLTPRPVAISLSWGAPEPSGKDVLTCPRWAAQYGCEDTKDQLLSIAISFWHMGIVTTVSAGDDGYGATTPADSPWVISVGGTSLRRAQNVRGWAEQVWEGTGSGCSLIPYKPPWQNDRMCGTRTISDVAFDADPWTGVAIYDSTPYYSHKHHGWKHGWLDVGGTSVGAPAIAAIYALANNVHDMPRGPGAFLYVHAQDLFDVTSGTNVPTMQGYHQRAYLIQAQPGYDAPTGWGTPKGIRAF